MNIPYLNILTHYIIEYDLFVSIHVLTLIKYSLVSKLSYEYIKILFIILYFYKTIFINSISVNQSIKLTYK